VTRAWALAITLGAAALFVHTLPRIQAALARPPADLVVDHAAARAFRDGYSPFTEDGARRAGVAIYGATGIGHPPTTSFWMLPLARLELQTASAVVGWASVLTLAAATALIAHALGAPLAFAALAFAYVVSTPFFLYHLMLGQISQLIAFALVLAWLALRRGREALAGVALGAACTLKLFPGVMVLYCAVTRRWRAAAVAAGVYAAVALFMTARFGLASWRTFLAAQKEVADTWMAHIGNLSLHGVAQRLISPACEFPPPVVPGALIASTLLSALLLALAARAARRDGLDLGFAVFATLSVLCSQWAWEHYAVLFVLPTAIAAAELRRLWSSDRPRAMAGIAVIVVIWVLLRIEVRTKLLLQVAYMRGDRGAHWLIHLFEALNVLPGVLLLCVLFALLRRYARSRA
jgi:alpha-1,2-mannosyltransferase